MTVRRQDGVQSRNAYLINVQEPAMRVFPIGLGRAFGRRFSNTCMLFIMYAAELKLVQLQQKRNGGHQGTNRR